MSHDSHTILIRMYIFAIRIPLGLPYKSKYKFGIRFIVLVLFLDIVVVLLLVVLLHVSVHYGVAIEPNIGLIVVTIVAIVAILSLANTKVMRAECAKGVGGYDLCITSQVYSNLVAKENRIVHMGCRTAVQFCAGKIECH